MVSFKAMMRETLGSAPTLGWIYNHGRGLICAWKRASGVGWAPQDTSGYKGAGYPGILHAAARILSNWFRRIQDWSKKRLGPANRKRGEARENDAKHRKSGEVK
jgi:hypothetical protein